MLPVSSPRPSHCYLHTSEVNPASVVGPREPLGCFKPELGFSLPLTDLYHLLGTTPLREARRCHCEIFWNKVFFRDNKMLLEVHLQRSLPGQLRRPRSRKEVEFIVLQSSRASFG